jgi:hypothetical protein
MEYTKTFTILRSLLIKTHNRIPFNSTVFADPDYVPFHSELGGDCLDQVVYLRKLCLEKGFKPIIVGFDKPHKELFHAAIIINNKYYLDPSMGAIEPIIVGQQPVELNFSFGLIKLKVVELEQHKYKLAIIHPGGSRSEISTRYDLCIKTLFTKQLKRKTERLSALFLDISEYSVKKVVKLKQYSKQHYRVIYDKKTMVKSGKIPTKYLKVFAQTAKLNEENFIRVWRLAERKIEW